MSKSIPFLGAATRPLTLKRKTGDLPRWYYFGLAIGLIWSWLLSQGIAQPAETAASVTSPILLQTSPAREVERGPHHRLMETVSTWRAPDGTLSLETNTVTVLGTGMFYEKNGAWVEP